ncbi:MAG: hypothetical protein AB7T37_07190 [Dehalococcoidia bacterium]
MNAELRRTAQEAALPAFVSIACVTAIALFAELKTEGTAAYLDPGWDRHLYAAMANANPLNFHLAPFCWRILVPLLAWLSPFALQPSFLALTLVSTIASGTLLYFLARAFGADRSIALGAIVLFYGVGWATRFQVTDFWIPDANATAFSIAAMLAAKRRRTLLFAALLAVGVLAKESVIFVAPLCYTLNAKSVVDRAALARASLAAFPAVLLLVLLRIVIPQHNGDLVYIASLPEIIARFPDLYPHYDYAEQFRLVAYEQRYQERDWDILRQYTIGTFGLLLLLLAAAGSWTQPRLTLKLSPFVALTLSQLLFATDTERLIAFATPALIVLAVVGLTRLDAAGWLDARLALPLAIPGFLLQLSLGDRFAAPAGLETSVALAALLAAVAANRLLQRLSNQHGPPGPEDAVPRP